jgi:hypothetical protein
MQLDHWVNIYNAELRKVGDANFFQFTTEDTQQNCIEHYETCDIERLLANLHWAECEKVRVAIVWYFVEQCVIEERRMLLLLTEQQVEWHKHQRKMLLHLLHCVMKMDILDMLALVLDCL